MGETKVSPSPWLKSAPPGDSHTVARMLKTHSRSRGGLRLLPPGGHRVRSQHQETQCRRRHGRSLSRSRIWAGALRGGHTDGAHGLSGRDWGQTVPQFLTMCLTPPRSRPPPWAAATTPPTPVRRPISVHFGVCVPHVCLGYTLVPRVLGCRSPSGGSAVVASAPPPCSVSREGAIR